MMRWMQQDPMGYVDGLNTQMSTLCNPATNTDPSGTDSQEWDGALKISTLQHFLQGDTGSATVEFKLQPFRGQTLNGAIIQHVWVEFAQYADDGWTQLIDKASPQQDWYEAWKVDKNVVVGPGGTEIHDTLETSLIYVKKAIGTDKFCSGYKKIYADAFYVPSYDPEKNGWAKPGAADHVGKAVAGNAYTLKQAPADLKELKENRRKTNIAAHWVRLQWNLAGEVSMTYAPKQ